jgi:hypothetical protein
MGDQGYWDEATQYSQIANGKILLGLLFEPTIGDLFDIKSLQIE